MTLSPEGMAKLVSLTQAHLERSGVIITDYEVRSRIEAANGDYIVVVAKLLGWQVGDLSGLPAEVAESIKRDIFGPGGEECVVLK